MHLDHEHEHDHAHDHAHPHTHDHGCGEHSHCDAASCAGCQSADPRAELIALMKYMVGHNASHANELAQLAKRLQTLGENVAYEQVMQAAFHGACRNERLRRRKQCALQWFIRRSRSRKISF